MREYELTVIYNLALAESGGPEAAVDQLTSVVEARHGKVLKTDHWGRRRMAYPINHAIDGDYVVSRVELDPAAVAPLEAALGINEQVYRHLIVRADELPVPPAPREPRPTATQEPAPAPEAAPAPEVEAPAASAETVPDAPPPPPTEPSAT